MKVTGTDAAISGTVIGAGLLMFFCAPALVRFQVRMLEWQIEILKQPWGSWPLRIFGALFAFLGILGIIQFS